MKFVSIWSSESTVSCYGPRYTILLYVLLLDFSDVADDMVSYVFCNDLYGAVLMVC